MNIIHKPKARCERGVWLVWCEKVGPSPRATLEAAYAAWARRRGLMQ